MDKDTHPNGGVETSLDRGCATITFFHPASNSLPAKVLAELASHIRAAGRDAAVRCIILQSAGNRAFCAGASFDELVAITSEQEGKEFFMGFARVINAIREVPQFVIGRVQGKAVGGGVGLASAVDYCLASEEASVKLSELAIGIGPFVVGPAVARKIGLSAMSQLTIDATSWRSAQWAHMRGLYAQTFATTAELDAAVGSLAQRLAGSNPEAMKHLKQNFWSDCTHWDTLLEERAAMSGKLVLSDFTKAAIAQFKAR